ncbi:hypothetical protein [Bradyrhizobium sp. sGM-13]|uniref:hypothetical protein n=1 Tax=Bradyrhizobium sp. sGM-13 TaxID=2831781 RepID=UPI001BCBAD17|nr:hypothetical protein [Bradyrhizobium sp. sGM-13]
MYRCDEVHLRAAILQSARMPPEGHWACSAADDPIMRAALYNEQAERRSWASMRSLFDEALT